MDKTVDWYVGWVSEAIRADAELTTMYDELEKMVRPEWKGDFAGLDDVMAIINSTPSDAINSGAIAMSGAKPIMSIDPNAPNVFEYDRVESLEDLLMWHFQKSNRTGTGSAMFDMSWSSLLYNGIAVQVHDLINILPKNKALWTPLQRRAWRNGRFLIDVNNFKHVHFQETIFGISTVCGVKNHKVGDVIAHWSLYANNDTKEGKQAQQGLKDLEERLDFYKETPSSDLRVVMYSVQDDNKICVFGKLTSSDEMEDTPQADFVFADQPNKKGFINWALRVAGSRLEDKPEHRVNPLLAPLYWSKSWDKLNFASSLIFSEPIRRAREPRSKSNTLSGEAPLVDRQNGNTIALKGQQEDYEVFNPITFDAGAMQIIGSMEGSMNRTTGASMIGDTTTISSDTPFATYSAMMKVAMSRLDRQREIIGDSVSDIAYLMLEWVDYTDRPLVGYAQGTKQTRGTGSMVPQGSQMVAAKGDFAIESISIRCKIVPKTPTDEAAQIAAAIQLSTQLNVPLSKVLEEKLGYENVGMLYDLWAQEALRNAEVQASIAKMQTKAEVEGQMEAQAAAQTPNQGLAPDVAEGGGGEGGAAPPMGAGGGMSQAAFGPMGGSAFNPAIGGANPGDSQPGMNKEQITGRTYAEEEI